MYLEHFGLKELPFSISPDPRYLYMSERHREALAHLIFGLNSDGAFILLTGDVGTGKTTISRCLLEQIPDNTHIALVLNPKVSALELLGTICDELRIKYPAGTQSIKTYIDYINRFLLGSHAQGTKTVILIEEAQNLDLDVLEQLRLLTNLETNERKLLQIILLGQPELLDILDKPELSQLSQRITARYHLKPLNEKEVSHYLGHRLAVAGSRQVLFPLPTIKRLYQITKGVPRLINVLCDRALLGCYVQGRQQVDRKTLNNAAKEVLGEKRATAKVINRSINPWIVSTVFASLMLIVVSILFYQQKHSVESLAAIETPVNEIIKSDVVDIEKKPEEIIAIVEPIIWPDEVTRLRTNSIAFQDLFSNWKMQYQPQKNGTPCFFAETKTLSCLRGRASVNELREINRPAVIKLIDENEQVYYATLTGLGKQSVRLVLASIEKTWTVKQLKRYWNGEFTLLWHQPPGYLDSIRPGHKGEDVIWLTKTINKLSQDENLPEDTIYQSKLIEKVRQFQAEQGLVADGVVGVRTLIRLNSALGMDAPLLANKG
jgi:general secretion pathway protein A